MTGVRLSPAVRDRVIAVIEALCNGAARFDGAVIFAGHVIRPVEVLAAVAASGSVDRFPALTVETMTKAFGQPVSARTYAEAALAMLVSWPRIEVRRQEDDAFARVVEDERRVEAENARRQELTNQRKRERLERQAALAAPAAKQAA